MIINFYIKLEYKLTFIYSQFRFLLVLLTFLSLTKITSQCKQLETHGWSGWLKPWKATAVGNEGCQGHQLCLDEFVEHHTGSSPPHRAYFTRIIGPPTPSSSPPNDQIYAPLTHTNINSTYLITITVHCHHCGHFLCTGFLHVCCYLGHA